MFKASDKIRPALFRMRAKNRNHFMNQIFGGGKPVVLDREQFPGHRPAQLHRKTPGPFINDETRYQGGLMADGKPYGAGRHLKRPAVAKWHADLFSQWSVYGSYEDIASRKKFGGFAQLTVVKYKRNFGKQGIRHIHAGRACRCRRFGAPQTRCGKAGGAQPVFGQIKRAEMAKSQYGGAAFTMRRVQMPKPFEVAARRPFFVRQPVVEKFQYVAEIIIHPLVTFHSGRIGQSQKFRPVGAVPTSAKRAIDRGTGIKERLESRVKGLGRKPAFCLPQRGKEAESDKVFVRPFEIVQEFHWPQHSSGTEPFNDEIVKRDGDLPNKPLTAKRSCGQNEEEFKITINT